MAFDNKNRGFDDIIASNYRVFFLNEDKLYCVDYIYEMAVEWDGKNWKACSFEEAKAGGHDCSAAQAAAIATVPPWDAFDALLAQKAEQVKADMEKLVATTPRKVIGYTDTSYGSDNFLPVEAGDLKDEEYAAIIKDFRAHGYFFTGQDYQDSGYDCTPVLDNYRYVSFSRRGFGGLMAQVRGDYSSMGYCHYTESMFIDRAKKVYPRGGLNAGIPTACNALDVDDETWRVLFDDVTSMQAASTEDEEDDEKPQLLIALPVPEGVEGFYWPNDALWLSHGDENLEAVVRAIGIFADQAEYERFQEYRELACTPWRDEYVGKTLLLIRPDCY